MRTCYLSISLLSVLFLSCLNKNESANVKEKTSIDFIISFGSCNNQNLTNNMWREILKNDPDIFIWGGDIIYSDTHDMKLMAQNYNMQKQDSAYLDFAKKIPVIGIWDDHDYGLNDGGEEYDKKDSVQQIFLDFFNVDSLSTRREQKGIYHSKEFKIGNNSVNIILLDTRYFRSKLKKDTISKKRYMPNSNKETTILGEMQWQWLEDELNNSNSDFNILISSIQFLSYEHGFESWGTMPLEVEKLKSIISKSKAKGIIILSGDRHIAEISQDSIANLNYPLIDFTSSGMTHSYTEFKGEENKFRVSKVISDKNFGILKFDLNQEIVDFEIRGENNILFESYSQKY
jgi:alkaline phosphatase D